mgnify:FL=1
MKFIYKHKSPNFDKRKKGFSIKYIVLHYTAMKFKDEAIAHLCNKSNKVSSHFLIDKLGKIYNLVDIRNRAWHAGKSYWQGKKDLNSQSIGIELDNSGYNLNFENYSLKQINSLIRLIQYLCKKYHIHRENILGHSDIAPYRKIDPGEKFPWKRLEKFDLSFKHTTIPKYILDKEAIFFNKISKKKLIKKISLEMLNKIGYDVGPAKRNERNFFVLIKAYQMHYRQSYVSGKLDAHTFNLICYQYINEILT